MVYHQCKIYGPYTRKDGRQHIIVVYPDGCKKTVSYPKYFVEMELGRYLGDNETVDHIDGDVTNNSLPNLQVLPRSVHAAKDARRLCEQSFVCPLCGSEFSLSGRRLSDAITNRKRGKAGPFCSRRCVGKYGKLVQDTGSVLPVSIIEPKYCRSIPSLYGETRRVQAANSGKPQRVTPVATPSYVLPQGSGMAECRDCTRPTQTGNAVGEETVQTTNGECTSRLRKQ